MNVATQILNDGHACHRARRRASPFTVRRPCGGPSATPPASSIWETFHYLLSAVHLFRDRLFGVGWIGRIWRMVTRRQGKALSLVFRSPLWPDDQFDMRVYVGDSYTDHGFAGA